MKKEEADSSMDDSGVLDTAEGMTYLRPTHSQLLNLLQSPGRANTSETQPPGDLAEK